MAGRVDFYLCPIAPALPLIKEGKLLALAVSTSKRTSALPDVPTLREAGVQNSEFDFWIGAFVPKKTPREIVMTINEQIIKSLEQPNIIEGLRQIGVEPQPMNPEDFDDRIAKEVEIAREVVKAAGIPQQ
jgi:tripartite-type tricarboxylate transporter receptor subunit TctC